MLSLVGTLSIYTDGWDTRLIMIIVCLIAEDWLNWYLKRGICSRPRRKQCAVRTHVKLDGAFNSLVSVPRIARARQPSRRCYICSSRHDTSALISTWNRLLSSMIVLLRWCKLTVTKIMAKNDDRGKIQFLNPVFPKSYDSKCKYVLSKFYHHFKISFENYTPCTPYACVISTLIKNIKIWKWNINMLHIFKESCTYFELWAHSKLN